jgi:sugar phosphate isomerase/epimerase
MNNRREFLVKSTLSAAGLLAAPTWLKAAPSIISSLQKPNSMINGVQVGCITYSFRSMPDQSAEATLQYVIDSGLSAIELMGDPAESFAGKPVNPMNWTEMRPVFEKQKKGEELSDNEKAQLAEAKAQGEAFDVELSNWKQNVGIAPFEKLRKMYKQAGVTIYAFKPNTFNKNNSDADIAYGMKSAKALGASHVTLELPTDSAQTLRLGKLGEKYGMAVGYHGHTQETYSFWDEAIWQSQKNGMNLDAGHYIAAGNTDLMKLIEEKHDHILSMHTKDRTTPAEGQKNLVWGEGDTPIKELLTTIQKNKYKFPATIELEYDIPQGSDAVKEVQKCVEFCRKSLA